MKSKWNLFKSFFKKEYILFKRYFFNGIGGLITIYIIFLLLLWGYKGLAGGSPNFGQKVEGLVVGYTLWMLALITYQDISGTIFTECREGTLEQLYMGAYPFRWILIMHTLSTLIFNIILVAGTLVLTMFTTGRFLNIDILSLTPIILLTLLCFYGIGLIAGGLTLIFKKIQNFLQIIQFALIGFIAAPIDELPWAKFLPGALGSNMINKIMVKEYSIVDFSIYQLIELAAIGVLYLVLGSIVYKICERKAMKKGVLGHY